MALLEKLEQIWSGVDHPVLIDRGKELRFADIASESPVDLSTVQPGDVVAIIGDFTPGAILTLLRLIDRGAIVVPLTASTVSDHRELLSTALADVVIEEGGVVRRHHDQRNVTIDSLRARGHAGLILFTTGTTGPPKAILHDMTAFLKKFETPRPALRTINFLLFDHIGGLNTLLHTLFNRGVLIAPERRTVESVLATCRRYQVELLPTTPTFMRMMLMSGAVPEQIPESLKVITYGTERMDQPTLDEFCRLLPDVDFRQTYGMSELGIVRAKSEARDSLFLQIGGEGVETKVVDGVLHIRSESRMVGYLNAPSPFDADGWYDTKDVVEVKGPYYRIVGRTSDVINVGGLKFMASEVEQVALRYSGVDLVKAEGKTNPITGHHVELTVQPREGATFDSDDFRRYLDGRLQPHMIPRRIRVGPIAVGHRFKKV